MWFNFAVESSPFRQMPSLGLFPCSLGWLIMGGESGLRFWKQQKAAVALCWCWLMYCSNGAWFHLSAALLLLSIAVHCCAELPDPQQCCQSQPLCVWQDLCHSKGNVHYRGFSWPHLGKAELEQQQVPGCPCCNTGTGSVTPSFSCLTACPMMKFTLITLRWNENIVKTFQEL